MVELLLLGSLATCILGPSPIERLYPRPTSGVTVGEEREPPPSLEVCPVIFLLVTVYSVQFLFLGTTSSRTVGNVNNGVT